MLSAIGNLLLFLLDAFFWVIIIQVILSWLMAFDVINVRNPQGQNLIRLLNKLTDPIFVPLRRYIPAVAGIDFSPIVVIFGIYLLKNLIFRFFI